MYKIHIYILEFWFVRSRGLCAKCGKKNCPGIKPQGSCGATKLQIHKFQNDELLNLVKRHADNANANADDQGAHGAVRDSASAAGGKKAEKETQKEQKQAKSGAAPAAKEQKKSSASEKHALLDKMGERTKELKALMACEEVDAHSHRASAAPSNERGERTTSNHMCADTHRLQCTATASEDLGDTDAIGFAGVVEQCPNDVSEGTLGEALTTHVVAPPIDTGGHTHHSHKVSKTPVFIGAL